MVTDAGMGLAIDSSGPGFDGREFRFGLRARFEWRIKMETRMRIRNFMKKMGLSGVFLLWGMSSSAFGQEKAQFPPEIAAKLKAAKTKARAEAQTKEKQSEEKTEPAVNEKSKTFEELVQDWMTPRPVPKKSIVRIDEHYAYPHSAVPFKMEIVKEEGDFVWLRGIPPENPESAMHKMWIKEQSNQAMYLAKKEFDDKYGPGKFLDFTQPVIPPDTIDALSFSEAGKGLPFGGMWQMGLDFADMNADGNLDLVLPPSRKGTPAHPWIYLGDGGGDFKKWSEAKWNRKVPFDYGDIKVADFDEDGYLDLVLAVHFKAQYILYGSKNHEFRRFKKLPSPDPRLTSRAVTIADFDRDGRMDVAFEAEIDLDLTASKRLDRVPTIWIVHNTEKGWKLAQQKISDYVIGDEIHATDVNGDGRPDLVVAGNTSGWRALLFLNQPDGSWKTWDEKEVFGNGFHFSMEPISRPSDNKNFVYGAFEQWFRMPSGNEGRTGLVRYGPSEADGWSSMETEVIYFDDREKDYYFRVGVGDLNGDGLEDLVAGRKKGGLEVWVQTSDGEFFRNASTDIDTGALAYSINIIDLNGDGFGDIVAGMADVEGASGGVRVWLSHPKE